MADIIKPKNRIAAVGIELEGGWHEVPKGLQIVRDGSVNFEEEARFTSRTLPPMKFPRYIGEIPSPVLQLTDVEDWMTLAYPACVNATCGLHVHMSFTFKLNYMRLMTPAFTPFIVKGLQRWAKGESLPATHPIWERITNPDHRHCAHVYLGDAQVKVDHKDFHSRGKPHSRYTAINYPWGQGKPTVECRLLPMMSDVQQGIRAVKEVILLTNTFLAKVKEREIRADARVALTASSSTHHYRIKV